MKALAQNTLIQNRYLIVHLIGKGGMGEVYLAVDQRLGSAVALKRTYFAGDEMLGNAFEREARTLARMRHPVLPKVSDHFGENDEQYLVMEHIAGDDLAKRLEAAQKPFPVSWVMFWADQLLDALSYLHSHEPPIIHRDIKPQNLKLTDENHIILLDFGLSKTSTGQTHISNSGSTGSVVGYTPHYAPMEQIRGIGTNPRSDIYSLSATLYQLMTNVVPDDALSRADAMLNGLSDPIEAPHKINPEIPTAVSDVILKGMEVSQERRYSNARDMQKALRRAFTQMQEAMSAQTVAFNIGDVMPVESPMAAAVEKTRLIPTGPIDPVVETPASLASTNGDIDLDATIAIDPTANQEQAMQAAMKTESFVPPAETNGALEAPTSIPVIVGGRDRDMQDSFVTVMASTPKSEVVEEAPAAPLPKEDKKSSGRLFAVVGGLAALLVLALGAAGAGWYFYNNYYAISNVVEPSPSPSAEPSVESTVPPTTTEAVVNSNVDTGSNTSTELSSETNVASPPDQPNDNSTARPETESQPARQTTVPRANTNRPAGSPGAKPTPKPKATRGRTDILQ